MPDRYATSTAFRELLDLLRDADAVFLDGPRAVADEIGAVEGYRWLTEVLSVSLDCYLWADAAHPRFVELVAPTRKFGGDNPDAYYYFAPLDPRRSYRVRGRKGDAVYISLCVYGGPTDGRWSNRIVSSINDRQMRIEPDGSFEIIVSPERHDGNWLALQPDAVAMVTRDYIVEPSTARKATWSVETIDAAPPPAPPNDADVAARLRCTTNFIRDLLNICPLPPMGDANAFMDPYRQQAVTYGWAAPDATYCMGRYELQDDEALIIEGRSPSCAFWNLCLWNPYLQTYDYRYHRVAINGGQTRYEADGSWRLVVAARDPGMPNWLSTAGHRRGVMWFRWFLAEETPERPRTRVVKNSGRSAVGSREMGDWVRLESRGHSVYELAAGLLLVFKPAGHVETRHAHGHAQRVRVVRGRLRVEMGSTTVVLDAHSEPMSFAAGQDHATEAVESTWLIVEMNEGGRTSV